MRSSLSICGAIEDVEAGLNWDTAALNQEVAWRAAALARMGIGPGRVVAIAHSGSARFFADLFAVWRLGAAAACLDTSLTSGEMRNVVQFADASLLLVDGTAIGDSPVPVLDLARSPENNGAGRQPATPAPDDPALILFTSGTTGTPKGVMLSFGALSARIEANIAAIGAPVLARTLVGLPTFFGHGLIGNSLTPLMAGGTIILHPRGLPLLNAMGAVIDRYAVSFMSSVPSMWRFALTCSAPPTGGTLRRVHIGSAPLSASLWSSIAQWSGAEVVNCYGITETANWIAGASSREEGTADGLVGKMWGGSAGVMDETGAVRSHGEGQIVIKNGCLMSGYLKREDLTAAAFNQGWFQTGDYGRIDQDDRIWITGRMKDEINRGGFKVQPAEIDVLLETHPAVAEACVFGMPDSMGGEAVAAAVRLEKGQHVAALQLQSWCAERLRRAAVPEHWFFVDEIPRTSRGKVSRTEVRKALAAKAEPAGPTPARPRTLPTQLGKAASETERELLEIWQSVLGVETVGVDDDYFALGGTSLMAARLFTEISSRFAVTMPVSTILTYPTVKALARLLSKQDQAPENSLVALKSGGERRLFFVHDGEGEVLLYRNLAQRMPDGLSVLAIEPRRAGGIVLAHACIEDMAKFYVAEVRRTQPRGPYRFAGMCRGAVIAYEMAAQLVAAGEGVDLLVLLDAVTPHAPQKASESERRLGRFRQALSAMSDGRLTPAQRVKDVAALGRKPINALIWEARQRYRGWSVRARFAILRRVLAREGNWPASIPPLSVREILDVVTPQYAPKPLTIPHVVLARAKSGEGADTPYAALYADADFGWSGLVKDLVVVDAEGGHTSMLQEPFVASLAAALRPYLAEPAPAAGQSVEAQVAS